MKLANWFRTLSLTVALAGSSMGAHSHHMPDGTWEGEIPYEATLADRSKIVGAYRLRITACNGLVEVWSPSDRDKARFEPSGFEYRVQSNADTHSFQAVRAERKQPGWVELHTYTLIEVSARRAVLQWVRTVNNRELEEGHRNRFFVEHGLGNLERTGSACSPQMAAIADEATTPDNLHNKSNALMERTQANLKAQHAPEAVATGQLAEASALALLQWQFQRLASAQTNLGSAYFLADQPEQAKEAYLRALSTLGTGGGARGNAIAIHRNLAELYMSQGLNGEAHASLQRALKHQEDELGEEHLELVNVLIRLGHHLDTQSQYLQAEPYYRRALAIIEKHLGPRSPALLDVLASLQSLCQRLGRAAEAASLAQRAAHIQAAQH